MDDTERDDAALRWLAGNLAWSRRLADYRDPNRWTRVLVTVRAIDRYERDRVASPGLDLRPWRVAVRAD